MPARRQTVPVAPLLFLSCEHGGNEVPALFKPWFKGAQKELASHRGWDIGALDLFEALIPMSTATISNRLSRLCIEFNRDEKSPQLFSPYTAELPHDLKLLLFESYYAYRLGFRNDMQDAIADGNQIRHISVHTFTPVLDGQERDCDIGLLYDPKRPAEAEFCKAWRDAIRLRAPGLRVRMNYPYKGTSDGYTRTLRKEFKSSYAGIELEVNQRFAPKGMMAHDIVQVVRGSLAELQRG